MCYIGMCYYFFKLYFIDYAITIVLISPLGLTSIQHPLLPQAILPTFVHVHGHAYKFLGYSISYTGLYIPMATLQLPIRTSESPHLFTLSPPLATTEMLSVSTILFLFFLFA